MRVVFESAMAEARASGRVTDALRAAWADPAVALGSRVRAAYGDQLPFLVKLLAADAPLRMSMLSMSLGFRSWMMLP